MSTEEQLTALKQKLQALETKRNQQTAGGSTGTASLVRFTVRVPRERKLRKFAGGRDDGVLEEWISDAKRATADAIDFLLLPSRRGSQGGGATSHSRRTEQPDCHL